MDVHEQALRRGLIRSVTGRKIRSKLHASLCSALIWGVSAAATHAQDAAPSAHPGVLTLSEALDYAQSHYPSARAALAETVAAQRDVDVARTAYLPQVNLLWQINRSTVNNITGVLLPQSVIPAISGAVLPPTDKSAWNSGAGALVTWRVVDFGVRAAKVDASRAAEAAAAQASNLTQLDVLTATTNAYMNLAAAQSLASVAKANFDRLHTFAGAVHVLVSNKLRPGVDSEQADAAEALAKTAWIAAEANVEDQRATLAKLVGRPAEEVVIDERLAKTDPPLAAATSDGRSLESHPAAEQQAARVKARAAELKAIDRSYAPQVDLLGEAWGRGSGRTASGAFLGGGSGLSPDVGDWSVGVQVTLPLGSYPMLRAEHQAQRARLEAEQDRYDQTLGDLVEQLAQARTAFRSAVEIAKTTPVAEVAARHSEEQQRVRFQSGLASVVDVAAVEAALVQAESQNAIARLNVWRALAGVANAEGDLSGLHDLAKSPNPGR